LEYSPSIANVLLRGLDEPAQGSLLCKSSEWCFTRGGTRSPNSNSEQLIVFAAEVFLRWLTSARVTFNMVIFIVEALHECLVHESQG
jgi:hypothetical protein